MPAYFTQSALSEYTSKFSHVNILDLESKVIVISKWSLELRKVNSAEIFTSYAGLECRLVIHSFKPQLKENLHPSRYPTNLYRDDEFKTAIQAFRHQQVITAASTKPATMPAIGASKGPISQGVISNSCGEWSFKEGTSKTVNLGGGTVKKASADAGIKVKGGAKRSAKKSIIKGKGSAVAAIVSPGKASKGKKSTGPKGAASPGAGKKSKPRSTSAMTVKQYQAYLKTVGGKKAKK